MTLEFAGPVGGPAVTPHVARYWEARSAPTWPRYDLANFLGNRWHELTLTPVEVGGVKLTAFARVVPDADTRLSDWADSLGHVFDYPLDRRDQLKVDELRRRGHIVRRFDSRTYTLGRGPKVWVSGERVRGVKARSICPREGRHAAYLKLVGAAQASFEYVRDNEINHYGVEVELRLGRHVVGADALWGIDFGEYEHEARYNYLGFIIRDCVEVAKHEAETEIERLRALLCGCPNEAAT